VKIFVDGEPFKRFHRVGPDTIQIDCAIDSHHYRIVTGYRPGVASLEREDTPPESATRAWLPLLRERITQRFSAAAFSIALAPPSTSTIA
jgi:hypothetical protein